MKIFSHKIFVILIIVLSSTIYLCDQPRKEINMNSDGKFVVEYIRYKIEPGNKDDFIKAYSDASKQLDANPHF